MDLSYVTRYYRLLDSTKAPNTVKNYVLHISKWVRYMRAQGLDWGDVTSDDVGGFVECLLDKGLMRKSINTIVGAVRGLFDWLISEQILAVNPVLMSYRMACERNEVKPLTTDEQRLVMGEIAMYRDNVRMAFLVMFATGLRVSEVCALLPDDIAVKDGRMMVTVRVGKWGSSRTVPVYDGIVAEQLARYMADIDDRSKPLFRLSARTLQVYAAEISQRAGVHFTCHKVRHTFACNMLADGVPMEVIQTALGHTSLNMTRWYTHTPPDIVVGAPTMGEAGVLKVFDI